MPRLINPHPPKSPELLQAEHEAAEALRNYFYRGLGVQAKMARDTGLNPAVLSKMGKGKGPISIEQAMLIEAASNGELLAEKLCPSRAELIQQVFQARVTRQTA